MPRVALGKVGGMKPTSAITKTMRVAADRLYDAFLRDPNPTKRFGIFDRAYSVFVRETEREFEKMATKIFRMWQLPEAVEPQDCLQDLHVEIVRILRKYKPEKATVAAYLVWNAFARAKKECNRQRGKVKDRDPSLHALVVSGLLSMGEAGPERFEDCIDRLALESDSIELDRECEAMVDAKNLLLRVRRHLSKQDARLVRRIANNGGNVRQTAFDMISAVEELDEGRREIALKHKTKKLMTALKNAANVWQKLQKQEQDNGEEGQQEERHENRSSISRRGRQSVGKYDRRQESVCNESGALRDRRSQARFQRIGQTRVADGRNRKRTYGSSFFLLCA